MKGTTKARDSWDRPGGVDRQERTKILKNLFNVFQERGFIEKTTDDEAIRELLSQPVTGYIGFDPTASSLHVGSLVPIMALAHMQRHGHRPIVLVGGGTALVGDPSGKTEMRQMLTFEQIESNAAALKRQLSCFLDFTQDRAILLNNADWLTKLNYITFLRDIGRHFSVNRMLASESCRLRLETGLSFIEFNYALLQAYDFLHLFQTQGCVLQMGGSDQWGNIVAGIDLIRRMERGKAFGITFPLITTSSGSKMGKTAKGAVWLDGARTTPYEYYQFWINTDDRDVGRFLALFTFLPMDEIGAVRELKGAALNAAKTILAFETTRIAHGEQAAFAAYQETVANFGTQTLPETVAPSSRLHAILGTKVSLDGFERPMVQVSGSGDSVIPAKRLQEGIPAFKLFHEVGLADSRGAARRLIEQGGGYVNGRRLEAFDEIIGRDDIAEGEIVLRAGKKRYHRLRVTP